jgi:hypothetical protein
MAEPTFQIPKEIIEPIVQSHVAAAVANALGGREQIVHKVVEEILTTKVDQNGQKSHYSSAMPWIQWLAQDCIKNAVKEAMTAEVAKHQEALKVAMKKELTNAKSPLVKKLVDAMVNGLTNENTLKWRLTIDVKDSY